MCKVMQMELKSVIKSNTQLCSQIYSHTDIGYKQARETNHLRAPADQKIVSYAIQLYLD